jgi:hypothetical protein
MTAPISSQDACNQFSSNSLAGAPSAQCSFRQSRMLKITSTSPTDSTLTLASAPTQVVRDRAMMQSRYAPFGGMEVPALPVTAKSPMTRCKLASAAEPTIFAANCHDRSLNGSSNPGAFSLVNHMTQPEALSSLCPGHDNQRVSQGPSSGFKSVHYLNGLNQTQAMGSPSIAGDAPASTSIRRVSTEVSETRISQFQVI